MNKRRLQAYLNKLVLFPRHAGKPKKGQVNDCTQQEVLDQVAQNTQNRVMGLEPALNKKREKAVAITKQLKDVKAYNKLRLEKMNQKWAGIREKRAKEAAEKNK